MKSIKQQYIDLKEGRMSQVNFMRNLRMTLPQYVTNVTSYGDAVKILRNKGILNESLIKQLEKGLEVEKEHGKDDVETAQIALDHLKEDPKYYTKLNKAGLEESETGDAPISKMSRKDMIDFLGTTEEKAKDMSDEELRDAVSDKNDDLKEEYADEAPFYNYNGKKLYVDNQSGEPDEPGGKVSLYDEDNNEYIGTISSIDREGMISVDPESIQPTDDNLADIIKRYEEEESGKYTTGGEQFPIKEAKSKWENTSGKSMYAQFKEINNLNGQEILIGIDFEMQENEELSKTEAAKIVIKNLKKNPVHYTAMIMAGKEMTEIPTIGKLKPGSDKMRPIKGEDSLVDKDNGMKPVKDVKKIKASANKASKETNKPEKGISLMSLVAKASRGVEKMTATGEKMKVVKEARLNLFPNEQPNEVTKQVETYIDSNPTLKAISKDIVLQNAADGKSILGYKSWDFLPEPALEKLELQFNVERDAEEHDDRLPTYYYVLTPKFKKSTQSPVAQALTKEDLMEIIREELKEYFDGRDNLTDTAGHQLDEDIYGVAGYPSKEAAAKKSQFKKKQYEPLDKTAAKNIELDNILDDAEKNVETAVRTVGNDVKLGIALINRAREKKPKLVSALKTALNLYK